MKHATVRGRMIPIFRSLISVPAGIERMPVPVFAALTTLGSLIWNAVFVLAGYALGENGQRVTGRTSRSTPGASWPPPRSRWRPS